MSIGVKGGHLGRLWSIEVEGVQLGQMGFNRDRLGLMRVDEGRWGSMRIDGVQIRSASSSKICCFRMRHFTTFDDKSINDTVYIPYHLR